ncbi:MAG: hypothetical protein WCX86_06880 [Candidatus Hydrogenedentales bacterium]
MNTPSKKTLPPWVWAIIGLVVIGITLALFFTRRFPEPGPSMLYDVSAYEVVEEQLVIYKESQRIALPLEEAYGVTINQENQFLIVGDSLLIVLDNEGNEISRRALEPAPRCVEAAPDGSLYISAMAQIMVLPSAEGEVSLWEALDDNTWITSLAASENFVYAADSGNARVLQYDKSGTLLREIGGKNDVERPKQFIVPSPYFDVAIDTMDSLWIANPGRLGVENYRHDGSLTSTWYHPGMAIDTFTGCCNPAHFTFKANNALVTMEKGINRVKVFDAVHEFQGVVATPKYLNEGWTPTGETLELAPIRDLAVDRQDRIVVLHGPLHCLLIFEEIDQGA